MRNPSSDSSATFLDFVVNDSNTRKVPEKEGHAKIMKVSELEEKKSATTLDRVDEQLAGVSLKILPCLKKEAPF
jgi:hypothetical protein